MPPDPDQRVTRPMPPVPSHPRRPRRTSVVVALALAATALAACSSGPGSIAIGEGARVSIDRPEGDGPHPVVLHVPGGGWDAVDASPGREAFGLSAAVEEGWAVVTVRYPTGDDVTAPEQVAAVGRALAWVRTVQDQDLDGPVVASAHSAGAHLLALAVAGLDAAARPDHVVLVAGVYDLADDVRASAMLRPGLERVLGCSDAACPAGAELEPIRVVDPSLPPTSLVHGRRDVVTPAAGSVRYAAALKAAGVPTDLHLVDGGAHLGAGTDAEVRRVLADVLGQLRDARSSR